MISIKRRFYWCHEMSASQSAEASNMERRKWRPDNEVKKCCKHLALLCFRSFSLECANNNWSNLKQATLSCRNLLYVEILKLGRTIRSIALNKIIDNKLHMSRNLFVHTSKNYFWPRIYYFTKKFQKSKNYFRDENLLYLSGRFNLLRKEGEGERISWAKERGRKSEEIRSNAVTLHTNKLNYLIQL